VPSPRCSTAAASAFLPFLPLQILLLNFLSDIPSTTTAADAVDSEQIARSQHWDLRVVRDFMVVFGLLSSGFDLLTFAVLLHGFAAGPTLFRTGWFVGSILSELAVLFVLRTRRRAWRSPPGRGLVASSLAVAGATLALPYVRRPGRAAGPAAPAAGRPRGPARDRGRLRRRRRGRQAALLRRARPLAVTRARQRPISRPRGCAAGGRGGPTLRVAAARQAG